ncbi:MAG: hypothetical protein JW917_02480 [Ignavibacteria bacterium]|nr:hypothetical protein [Ignavibacteria bacterium]
MNKINRNLIFLFLISFTFMQSCNIFKPKGQDTEKQGEEKISTVTIKDRKLKDIRYGAIRLGKYVYKASTVKKDKTEQARIFREIKYQFGNLILTEDTYSPTEKTSDKYVLDSNSLLPMFRNITIGINEVVSINFSEKSLEGFIVYPSGKSPFEEKISSPVFGDGFSLEIALTLVPLEKNYKVNIPYFDYRIEDIREVVVEVSDVESVRTENGTYSCHKVIVTDSDHGITDYYWISNKDYPVIVKSEVGLIYDKVVLTKKMELVEVY